MHVRQRATMASVSFMPEWQRLLTAKVAAVSHMFMQCHARACIGSRDVTKQERGTERRGKRIGACSLSCEMMHAALSWWQAGPLSGSLQCTCSCPQCNYEPHFMLCHVLWRLYMSIVHACLRHVALVVKKATGVCNMI